MFNLGSNDKEELQENMQEIKNLIQDDDGAGKPSSNQGGNAGRLGSPNQSQQSQQPQNSFEEKVQQQAEREQQQQDLGDQVDFSQSQSSGQSQQAQQPSQEQVLNKDGEDEQQEQESQDLSRKFNTQSGSSPDEPMFLREEEFLNVREMIEEMGYLTKEIENNLDGLKKTVHQERSTSKNAMELVQAFSQRRAEIESTIESGQK